MRFLPLRLESRCLDQSCFWEKQKIYRRNYLYLASQTCKVKELEEERLASYEHSNLVETYSWKATSDADNLKAETIIRGGCDNLRIAFDEEKEPKKDSAHCIEGYPRAMIVCKNRNGACRCLAGYDIVKQQEAAQAFKKDMTAPSEASANPAPEPAAPAARSAEELRKAAADQLKAKRADNETAVKLMSLAGQVMGRAAIEGNDGALVYLILGRGLNYPVDHNLRSNEALQKKAAEFFNSNLEWWSLDGWLQQANKILEACNLPQLSREDAGAAVEEILARRQFILPVHQEIPEDQ